MDVFHFHQNVTLLACGMFVHCLWAPETLNPTTGWYVKALRERVQTGLKKKPEMCFLWCNLTVKELQRILHSSISQYEALGNSVERFLVGYVLEPGT